MICCMTSLFLHLLPHCSFSLSVHCTALAGGGTGGFLWQPAPPLLAETGPVLLAGSVEGKQGGSEGRGEGENGLGRREAGGVEAWSQLVMKSSLFIFRRQSGSERARGLRSSTAFSASKVCWALLRSALPVPVSVPVCHSWEIQRYQDWKRPLQTWSFSLHRLHSATLEVRLPSLCAAPDRALLCALLYCPSVSVDCCGGGWEVGV